MAHRLRSGKLRIFTIVTFAAAACAIIVLSVLPEDFWEPPKKEWRQGKVLVTEAGTEAEAGIDTENIVRMNYESSVRSIIPLEDGELQVSVLSEDFDGDGAEESVIAYRNLLVADNPIYITYIDYDQARREYTRLWSAPTLATRPGTLSLFSIDLIGDHQNCIVVTGMNQKNEQTLSAFRILPEDKREGGSPFYKVIAEISIDGVINIQESERSQAYQMGFARGASFVISDKGRDPYSANELDQVERTYTYDPIAGEYERSSTVRVPGAQIEAKLVREILSGGKKSFEAFIDGLWYHVTAEGTIDNNKYIYFDTTNAEVNFYTDDTQQVYQWLSSYATRYGLFISSQNISVSTLNRKIDVELESIDSIRVKVSEDVRMRIIMNAPWDGSYRKAKTLPQSENETARIQPSIKAKYETPLGSMSFEENGQYKVDQNGVVSEGRYIFFRIGKEELLELVPHKNQKASRQTYRIVRAAPPSSRIILQRVRLGIHGVYEFREAPIPLR